jgi:hypothetical protein
VRAADFKSVGGCGDTASAGSIPVRFRHFGFEDTPPPAYQDLTLIYQDLTLVYQDLARRTPFYRDRGATSIDRDPGRASVSTGPRLGAASVSWSPGGASKR